MTLPLMPKATAVWLIENTSLTFEQISKFCGMHMLEVQGIADGEVAGGIIGKNPVAANQLTKEEIELCEKDPKRDLKLVRSTENYITGKKNKKKSKYTPVARRQDKPDAIAWLLKHCEGITDLQIARLIGTTKNTIASVKEKTHWNWANIKPHDPVLLGLCTQKDLDNLVEEVIKAKEKAANLAEEAKKIKAKRAEQDAANKKAKSKKDEDKKEAI